MLPLRNSRMLSAANKFLKVPFSVRSIKSCEGVKELKDNHIFKKIWKKHELIEHLSSNVCYEDENYIVLNKPYGVRSRFNLSKTETFNKEGASCESTLHDILPDLAAKFHVPDMNLIVNPERFFSGATLLSKHKEIQGVLQNFQKVSFNNRNYSFLTVVLGKLPESLEDTFHVYFNKEENLFEMLNTTKKTARVIKELEVTRINYKHEVLCSSEYASLVKVDMNYNHTHCLRLVLATKCFSPVLGDLEYSSKITTLFGVPLLVPLSNTSNTRQNISPEILNRLQLSPEDSDCLPCHIHLHSMMFRVKHVTFVVSAPPSEYFMFTCERLGLDIKDCVKIIDNYSECMKSVASGF